MRTAARIAAAILAINGLMLGIWAAFTPRSFYADFPGGGMAWVSLDGPYNEHLVRDVGALWLAVAVIAILAAVIGTRPYLVMAGAAWLVFALPHFIYHLRHSDVFSSDEKTPAIGGIGFQVLLGVFVLIAGVAQQREPATA